MRERLIALRERRAALVARAAAERAEIEGWIARTDALAQWAGAAGALLDELKRHPLWILLTVALVTALRPKRIVRWLASGWSLWQLLRRARAWLGRVAPRP